jgi:hypothetical protein
LFMRSNESQFPRQVGGPPHPRVYRAEIRVRSRTSRRTPERPSGADSVGPEQKLCGSGRLARTPSPSCVILNNCQEGVCRARPGSGRFRQNYGTI